MGDELRVDPDALNSAGAAYREAASELSRLQVDAPLHMAAGGVSGLRTADACRTAGIALLGQKDVVARDVTGYATDLAAAAVNYRSTDANAGTAVAGSMPGG